MGSNKDRPQKLYVQVFDEDKEAVTDLVPLDVLDDKSAALAAFKTAGSRRRPLRRKINPQSLLISLTFIGIIAMVAFVFYERSVQSKVTPAEVQSSKSHE